jgi:hypothetical protein
LQPAIASTRVVAEGDHDFLRNSIIDSARLFTIAFKSQLSKCDVSATITWYNKSRFTCISAQSESTAFGSAYGHPDEDRLMII